MADQQSQEARFQLEKRLESITLSTGNVNKKYLVRDIIFATDRVTIDLYDETVNPNDVFKKVCQKLKELALAYEADAVINCHFEQKISQQNAVPMIEIFAYGTVVQFTQTTIG